MGANHTITGGLRLSLGSARETAAREGTEQPRQPTERRNGQRIHDPLPVRVAVHEPHSARRCHGARETQGEPSTTNRSGQSAALVMPIRGVTTTRGPLAGGDDLRARPAHREAVLVRVMPSA